MFAYEPGVFLLCSVFLRAANMSDCKHTAARFERRGLVNPNLLGLWLRWAPDASLGAIVNDAAGTSGYTRTAPAPAPAASRSHTASPL